MDVSVSYTPCSFTPGERASGTHWVGGWVGPSAGLDMVVRRKNCPAHSLVTIMTELPRLYFIT